MKRVFELKCNFSQNWSKMEKLFQELPKRMLAVEANLAYKAAEHAKDGLRARIPATKEYKAYRESLEVVQVRGGRAGEYAYAVQIDEGHKLVRTANAGGEILAVRSKGAHGRRGRAVEVLVNHGPWTYETIPFLPKKSEALLVPTKASRQEVARVALQNRRSQMRWKSELVRTGVRPKTKVQLKFARGAKTTDADIDALKLEFGLDGSKSKPAWRLSILELRKKGYGKLLQDKKIFGNPLTDPSDNMWRKGPPKTPHTITAGKARKFRLFQDKVT